MLLWQMAERSHEGRHRWQGETWYYGPCGKDETVPGSDQVMELLWTLVGSTDSFFGPSGDRLALSALGLVLLVLLMAKGMVGL